MNPSLHQAAIPERPILDDRLHVVMVDEELPYPPTSGKRIRTLNLTLRLAQGRVRLGEEALDAVEVGPPVEAAQEEKAGRVARHSGRLEPAGVHAVLHDLDPP